MCTCIRVCTYVYLRLPVCVPVYLCVYLSGMWASCCNWFCVDSADVEESGGGERRHQSYTNSAFSSQPSPEHTCKACGGRLDTPAKKVTTITTNVSVQTTDDLNEHQHTFISSLLFIITYQRLPE